ncbi:MAG: hypothetical protein QME58_10045, partial [Bacteroidota bacterium]|nr:hypothetical protein [Bacteroidota bacterium]
MKPNQLIIQSLNLLIIIFLFCCLILFTSCRERVVPPDVPPYIPPIVLTAEDVGVVDAFIKIKFVDTTVSRTFKLTRDEATIVSAECTQPDTLILDEGLLPKHTYKYRAYRVVNNISVDSSDELSVLSMDTTSHNFNFEVFYLGDGNSSVLYDVAVLSDTLAYAVGEIYKRDSAGNFETEPYN